MVEVESRPLRWYQSRQGVIALLAVTAIVVSLLLRITHQPSEISNIPLYVTFLFGGTPLCWGLVRRALRGEFGSDLLAGISIITSLLLEEYLAGTFVILMLSGGEAVEAYALRKASSVLDALANRMPHRARRNADGVTTEISLDQVTIGDKLEVLPHDICPVDGVVVSGTSTMDESFLTGEPYQMPKAPGATVISGAINGQALLLIEATALPGDSRYQKIAKVIESQASKQVPMRRLGDMLGAWYTPIALAIAILAWVLSGDSLRFLAVLVVATPCPLLIAIPVAIISAISVAAKRGIIVKNPAALERVNSCSTIILDKTGTLTYGKPLLTEIETFGGFQSDELLRLSAALEQYSKHPLAEAVIQAAREKSIILPTVTLVSEKPGKGLIGMCDEREIAITGRKKLRELTASLPPQKEGLEFVMLVDNQLAGVFHFRDIPRTESKAFVRHLSKFHGVTKVMILSGDRAEEVQHLAKIVGISDIEGGLSPEEKLTRVKAEDAAAPTLYIGDGINDAPSLQAATVGIALGTKSDITAEAADIVILEPSLEVVDEFIHISARMRSIALQSAVGGMAISIVGMLAASLGLLTPLAGAIGQEVIDIFAVLNALRVAFDTDQRGHDLRAV